MDIVLALIQLLRAHREGVLLSDGVIDRTNYIIDGATGMLIMPVAQRVMEASELVLCVPDDGQSPSSSETEGPRGQLLLAIKPDGPSAAAYQDRWEAMFGKSRLPRWISAEIETAKLDGFVVDDEFSLMNPWAKHEGALCKRLNADRAVLERACERIRERPTPGAMAVGVDPYGIDVRSTVGAWPVRVEVPDWVEMVDKPDEAVAALLQVGGRP